MTTQNGAANRAAILRYLKVCDDDFYLPRTAEVAEATKLSRGNARYHLDKMSDAMLVAHDGTWARTWRLLDGGRRVIAIIERGEKPPEIESQATGPRRRRQRAILLAICEYHEARGYPPSMRDIMAAVPEARSTCTVRGDLDALEKAGLITRKRGRNRTIVPTERGMLAGAGHTLCKEVAT